MTLLTLFYDISALQKFREDLGKIEQLRLIVPNLKVANIEVVQEKIKVVLAFDKKYREIVINTFGVDEE